MQSCHLEVKMLNKDSNLKLTAQKRFVRSTNWLIFFFFSGCFFFVFFVVVIIVFCGLFFPFQWFNSHIFSRSSKNCVCSFIWNNTIRFNVNLQFSFMNHFEFVNPSFLTCSLTLKCWSKLYFHWDNQSHSFMFIYHLDDFWVGC